MSRRSVLVWVGAAIIILGVVIFCWQLNQLPLTAYDEAVYGQVTRDTLKSGNIFSLQRLGQPWLEKPPLYFWLAMGSVTLFGPQEWALRLPSVLGAIFICLMVYLLIRKLGLGSWWSVLTIGVLTAIPYWYILMRQVRVDSLLILMLISALYFLVASWQRKQFAIWIGPLLGLAVMTKSVTTISVLPMLFVFSFVYRQWDWLRNRWLYYGLALGLTIIVPWHLYQTKLYGQDFWSIYLGFNILQRASEGFGLQQIHWYDYFLTLWKLAQPWYFLWIVGTVAVVILRRHITSDQTIQKLWLASLGSALVVIILFSLFKTHIPTYVLPAYPFIAISLVCSMHLLYHLVLQWRPQWQKVYVFSGLLGLGFACLFGYRVGLSIMPMLHFYFDSELKEIGQTVALQYQAGDRLYQLAWPVGDTLSYYAHQPIATIKLPTSGTFEEMEGPFFLFMQTDFMPIFFDEQGQVLAEYATGVHDAPQTVARLGHVVVPILTHENEGLGLSQWGEGQNSNQDEQESFQFILLFGFLQALGLFVGNVHTSRFG